MGKIIVAGLGPGGPADMTAAVGEALGEADAVVGYQYYFRFAEPYLKAGCECVDTGMKHERQRAELAISMAAEGKNVVVISSGDAGIYGMAPLIYELKHQHQASIDVEVLPGISAFQKAASLLGAPIGHDMCIISLSDLLTPWATIERRILAAASADFVTAVYNPKSHGRYWQLYRLRELFLQERSPDTPVGYVRQAGRQQEEVHTTTLAGLDPESIDMFTVVIIGNSQSYLSEGKMITPRGYRRLGAPGIGVHIGDFLTLDCDAAAASLPCASSSRRPSSTTCSASCSWSIPPTPPWPPATTSPGPTSASAADS